jgi:hypothetical protein
MDFSISIGLCLFPRPGRAEKGQIIWWLYKCSTLVVQNHATSESIALLHSLLYWQVASALQLLLLASHHIKINDCYYYYYYYILLELVLSSNSPNDLEVA